MFKNKAIPSENKFLETPVTWFLINSVVETTLSYILMEFIYHKLK